VLLARNAGRTGTSQRSNLKLRGSRAARSFSIRTAKPMSKLSANRIRSAHAEAAPGQDRRFHGDRVLLCDLPTPSNGKRPPIERSDRRRDRGELPLPALVQDILALFKAGMGWVLPPPIARCRGADDRHRDIVKSLRKIAIVLTGSSPHEWPLCAKNGPSSNVAFDPNRHCELDGHTPVLAPRLASLLHGIGLL
jgi:hypothetical protein